MEPFSLLKFWRTSGDSSAVVDVRSRAPDTNADSDSDSDIGSDSDSFFDLELTRRTPPKEDSIGNLIEMECPVKPEPVSISKPQSPISLLKSGPKFRVFLPSFQKPKSDKPEPKPVSIIKHQFPTNTSIKMKLLLIIFFLASNPIKVAATKINGQSSIIFIPNATARGAVCLDGSPGVYSMEEGYGSGVGSWLIYLYGGAWCDSTEDCRIRSRDLLGSTKNLTGVLYTVHGIADRDPLYNPDFHNWNLVGIWYCDGGSFSGNVEDVDPSTNLHYRGARIFSAVVEDLLEKGLKNADNALLTGCSAGGLGTIINCDKFRSLIPPRTTVKCVADAGFFINEKNLSGYPFVGSYMESVVTVNGMLISLNPSCREDMRRLNKKESLCVFPENLASYIKTPIFFVNTQYDSYQIKTFLVSTPPDGKWNTCRLDIRKCSSEQLVRIQLYRIEFLSDFVKGARISPSRGHFINGCFDHCQTDTNERWLTPTIKGTSIAKAVGDWYFERKPFKEIGIRYPLDDTCYIPKG